MKRFLRTLLLIVFSATFLISGYFLLDYFLESREQSEKYDALAQMVASARETAPTADPGNTGIITEGINPHDVVTPQSGTISSAMVKCTDPDTGETVLVLPEYAELYKMNSDFAGWIQIPDTEINYPIMHTPENPDYYLHTNFYHEYSSHGCLYAREACDLQTPSDNVTIYGHNMKDGTMFHALMNYEDYDFWKEHQTILLDNLGGHYEYQVMAVFTTTASVGRGFDYHLFVDASDEADFNAYVSKCKELSLFDTGVTAEYGDKLITLSTCEYSQTNGRLVVVAKRITQ